MAFAAQLLEEGKITSDEYIKWIMSGYLHLESQNYDGMKDLMVSTRCSIAQAQANAARRGLDVHTSNEFQGKLDPKLFSGQSHLVSDNKFQKLVDSQRENRGGASKTQPGAGKRKRT
ncbi:unnamed protein product [Peniophora sp. CBMAI 1063]|nr:unnamed protein product [Peniophora sp. CBMAI 1063]